jgi:hypothetical protein
MSNPYVEEGFKNRREYLESLAMDYGVDPLTVMVLADTLGPNEDFDGLVTELEDLVALGDAERIAFDAENEEME